MLRSKGDWVEIPLPIPEVNIEIVGQYKRRGRWESAGSSSGRGLIEMYNAILYIQHTHSLTDTLSAHRTAGDRFLKLNSRQ
jgi:hypothetical protein